MDTDRNLLFGVLAMQVDLIDSRQFVEACTAWTSRKQTPLAELLVERGWITPADRADVERLLERKLKKHGGDARASLADVPLEALRQALSVVNDPDVQRSLADLPPGLTLLSTLSYQTGHRERYTLSRLHSRGGIGQVWLAHDGDLGRDVALKELRPEQDNNPRVCVRFLQEACVTGQLEHPGIVPVYELSRRADNQKPFYTMRFIKGLTLAEAAHDYHQKRRQGEARVLDLHRLLHAFVGVCQAVAYAHSRGVIHRDLKPQNVVLGDFGEVILLDWGLAKVRGNPGQPSEAGGTASRAEVLGWPPRWEENFEQTLQGQVIGTPAYMAPEQATGQVDRIEPRTDVYGLGTILYQLLTDRPPFQGEDTLDVLRRVQHEEPARPREVWPGTPPALDAICRRAMAKKRDDRYASAAELAREVQHWLADEPVQAYREPLAARLGRWTRRHKPLVAGLAAAALVAVLSLGVATVLLTGANERLTAANLREQHARELAQRQRQQAEANFQLAWDAVDKYFIQVSDSPQLRTRGLERLRLELLQTAREFYEQFVRERGEQPELQVELARSYFRLASLTDAIASRRDALRFYEQAVAILEPLVRDHPDKAEYRLDLAKSHGNLGGVLLDIGERARAEAAYQQALSLETQLVQEYPDNVRYQHSLAMSHNNIGLFYLRSGQRAKAESAYLQALDLRRTLAQAHPANAEYQRYLARSYNNLANLYSRVGQGTKVEEYYQQALAIRQKLAQDHPNSPEYQSDLASIYVNFGVHYREQGQTARAEENYQQALTLYEKRARAQPYVTDYQTDLALVHRNLGNLYRSAGELAKAEAAFQQSLALYDRIVQIHPDVDDYRSGLASTHSSLGSLYRTMDQPVRAEAAHRQALDLRQQLARAHPEAPEYQDDLAASYHNLANLYMETDRPQEAAAAYQQGVTIGERLTQAHPRVLHYQKVLAVNYGGMGNAHAALEQPAKAEAAYRQALAIQERLAQAHPQVLDHAFRLGETCWHLGVFTRDQGQPAAALDWFARAVATFQAVLQKDPRQDEAREFLGLTEASQARTLRLLGRRDEALAAYDRALKLEKDEPRRLGWRLQRSLVEALSGEYARAVALAEDLTGKPGVSGKLLYAAAGVCAAAAVGAGQDTRLSEAERKKLAEHYAGRAVALLARARDAGLFKDRAAIKDLRKDKDLDPLRSRDDFRKLLAELEVKPQPSGK